jgi:hypothetical protein
MYGANTTMTTRGSFGRGDWRAIDQSAHEFARRVPVPAYSAATGV